ncbi:MAG: phosphopantetheine-binding protein [Lachnospiraceae bacterium]|nr:phosphopantetheine-binding protein [Lachnospiraceae bacterium]
MTHENNLKAKIESSLFKMWEQILEKSDFSFNDDFYDLGGTSLQAFSLVLQIKKEFKIELQLMYVLDDFCISSLAELLEDKMR